MDFAKANFEEISILKNVPIDVSSLSASPNQSAALTDITVCFDNANQFTKITNFKLPEYYLDYFMTTTWSESQQELQQGQVERLVALASDRGISGSNLIEIGCGDGSFLSHAARVFSNVVGVEPSAPFASASREKGFEVIEGFVSQKSLLTEQKFEFFVSRQVFEHLPDPLDCLLGIRKMLKPGALGLIEVPNGFRALQLGRFFEFFPDHINYYSVNSLVSLASSAGLNVLSCNESFNSDYLELWVQWLPEPSSFGIYLEASRTKVIDSLKSLLANDAYAGPKFLFGCGAKTLSIISSDAAFFSERIKYAVDSDPNKVGKFIPNTSIEILNIQDPRLSECSHGIILALSYISEIAALISSKLPNCETVHTLSHRGDLVRLS